MRRHRHRIRRPYAGKCRSRRGNLGAGRRFWAVLQNPLQVFGIPNEADYAIDSVGEIFASQVQPYVQRCDVHMLVLPFHTDHELEAARSPVRYAETVCNPTRVLSLVCLALLSRLLTSAPDELAMLSHIMTVV